MDEQPLIPSQDPALDAWLDEFLGPFFAEFLIRLERERRGRKMAFVARDGWLLWKLYSKMFPGSPEAGYVRLSRAALRAASCFDAADVQDCLAGMAKVKAGEPGESGALAYFGMQGSGGLEVERVLDHGAEQRRLLGSMLGGLDAELLVDIGWGGSIAKLLDKAGFGGREWVYLGGEGANARNGLMTRSALGRSGVIEMKFMLESVCREQAGTCVGYRELEGGGEGALLAPFAGGEALNAKQAAPIQERLVERCCEPGAAGLQMAALAAFKQGFFPPESARGMARRLFTSESHNPDWAERVCPQAHGRAWTLGWAKGFACPWKGAWAMSSSGRAGAWLYMCARLALDCLPASVERLARRLLAS